MDINRQVGLLNALYSERSNPNDDGSKLADLTDKLLDSGVAPGSLDETAWIEFAEENDVDLAELFDYLGSIGEYFGD